MCDIGVYLGLSAVGDDVHLSRKCKTATRVLGSFVDSLRQRVVFRSGEKQTASVELRRACGRLAPARRVKSARARRKELGFVDLEIQSCGVDLKMASNGALFVHLHLVSGNEENVLVG